MWDALDSEHKNVCTFFHLVLNEILIIYLFVFYSQVYKKKTEAAKKEYLKALAAYRASLVSKVSHNHLFY